MDFTEFAKANRERCESPYGFNHTLGSWSPSDWMVAAGGELGEAMNVCKKLNRCRDGIPGNIETQQELLDQFQDEIADAVIYLDLVAQASGFSLEDAIRRKWNRTSAKIGYLGTLPCGALVFVSYEQISVQTDGKMEDLTMNLREIKAMLTEVATEFASPDENSMMWRVNLGRKAVAALEDFYEINICPDKTGELVSPAAEAANRLASLEGIDVSERRLLGQRIGRLADAIPAEPTAGAGAPGSNEGGEGEATQQGGPFDWKQVYANSIRRANQEGKIHLTPFGESLLRKLADEPEDTIEVEAPEPVCGGQGDDKEGEDVAAWKDVTDALIDRLVEERVAHIQTKEASDLRLETLKAAHDERDSLWKQLDDLRATVANLTDSGIAKDKRIADLAKRHDDIIASIHEIIKAAQWDGNAVVLHRIHHYLVGLKKQS